MFNLLNKSAPWRKIVRQADQARDAKRFREAGGLYQRALQVNPKLGGIHLQAGHMYKEVGEYDTAEEHYLEASSLMPDSAEVALQLGHFYKTKGQLDQAFRSYHRASELEPHWPVPQNELASMHRSGWRDGGEVQKDDHQGEGPAAVSGDAATDIAKEAHADDGSAAIRSQPVILLEECDPEARPDDLALAGLYGKLAPELLPVPLREMLRYSTEWVGLRQFGIQQNTFWGHKKVARGVEAIRGVCISKARLRQVHAKVNGLPIYSGTVTGPFELEYEPDKTRIHKYAFNIWADFSDFAPGLYELELRFPVAGEADQTFVEDFVIEPPLLEADHPDSDGVINLAPGGVGSVDDQVMSRAAIVHEAVRPNQIGEVKSILLTRADQLGDLVASIPAIARVRELFPDAKLVGMLGPANIDLARTLGLFDDLIEVDHYESWHQRTRTLTLTEQVEIKEKLAPYRFDVAIDLSQSLMSRPLLMLSGARFTYGFHDPHWPRFSSSFQDHLYDVKNRREAATHSKRVLAMVDRLGTLTRETSQIIRRDDLSPDRLARLGIAQGERYAVLHTGARIVWSRWAHYPELALRLLEDTDLKVVYFGADRNARDRLPPELLSSNRFIFIDSLLPFDDFDALISFASLYVGNDSGPKHLASLRGVPVVSIHAARINWSEWGQEHTGVIISRKVPCAGCTVYHDPDECGKDFACMKIGFEDVYPAVRRYV